MKRSTFIKSIFATAPLIIIPKATKPYWGTNRTRIKKSEYQLIAEIPISVKSELNPSELMSPINGNTVIGGKDEKGVYYIPVTGLFNLTKKNGKSETVYLNKNGDIVSTGGKSLNRDDFIFQPRYYIGGEG
jgi:hypothetical protein